MICLLAAAPLLASGAASAHDGYRFTVEVVRNKLQAQGINTGPPDDAPAVRPYINVIHNHWRDVDTLGAAVADLPGFDVPHYVASLVGQRLELQLIGAAKWSEPLLTPGPSAVPRLSPLDPDEVISITGPFGEVDSQSPGTLLLSPLIPVGGVFDLDLFYQVSTLPVDEVHVLEFVLSARPASGAPASIEPSDPIYVLLAPDVTTPHEGLHQASLFLEANVSGAVTIPEPSAFAVAGGLAAAVLAFGRRRRAATMRVGLCCLALILGGETCRAVEWAPLLVGVQQTQASTATPVPQQVRALRVDLRAPSVRVMVTPSNGEAPLDCAARTTSAFLAEFKCQAAINGSVFHPLVKQPREPQDVRGLSLSQGDLYSPANKYDAFLFSKERRARLDRAPRLASAKTVATCC